MTNYKAILEYYAGFLTIERECGDTPEWDIERASSFLREQLAKLRI